MRPALRVLVGVGAICIASFVSTLVGHQFVDHVKPRINEADAITLMAFGATFVLVFVPLVLIGNGALNLCFGPQTSKQPPTPNVQKDQS